MPATPAPETRERCGTRHRSSGWNRMKAGLEYDSVIVSLTGTPVGHREQLRRLLREKSLWRGKFLLSSGKTSDYYIDCKLTTLDPEGVLYHDMRYTVYQDIRYTS
jgi:hypothetical protein